MRYPVEWSADKIGLVSATLYGRRQTNRYIVIEAVPGGGWDWVAWTGRTRRDVSFGAAATLEAAKESAMRAADAMWPADGDAPPNGKLAAPIDLEALSAQRNGARAARIARGTPPPP